MKTLSYSTKLSIIIFLTLCRSLLAAEPVELLSAQAKQWKQAGSGHFSEKDGIFTSQDGMGLWWYAGKSFKNATFDIEFRLPDPAFNSGVFFRFPNPEGDPRVAVQNGYECQICGNGSSLSDTGSIFDIQAPTHSALKAPEEWNICQITTIQNYIIIKINGELVNVFETLKDRGGKEGYIGLQNHDPVSKVDYRKILVREWDDDATVDEILKKLSISRTTWVASHARRKVKGKALPWAELSDMGPAWANTFGDHYFGQHRVNVLKGLNIEVSQLASMRALFDTETLRLSSAHKGGLRWGGIPWTSNSDTKVTMDNKAFPIMETSPLAGWTNREGSFEDTREVRGSGNFPSDHMKYHGYFKHGTQTILDYSVHGSRVLDMLSGVTKNEQSMMFRQFDMAASTAPRSMLVFDSKEAQVVLSEDKKSATVVGKLALRKPPALDKDKVTVVIDHTTREWSELSMGAPSANDLANKLSFRVVPSFTKAHAQAGAKEGIAVRLNDGKTKGAANKRRFFFENQKQEGRLEMDLKTQKQISRIHVFSEHYKNRKGQNVTIYTTDDPQADAAAEESVLEKSGWKKLTQFKTGRSSAEGNYGVAVALPENESTRTMRKILIVCKNPPRAKFHTHFTEVDIYEKDAPVLRELASTLNLRRPSFVAHLDGLGTFRDAGNGMVALDFPASDAPMYATLSYTSIEGSKSDEVVELLKKHSPKSRELSSLTKGGVAIYPEVIFADGNIVQKDAASNLDKIPLPKKNPWMRSLRPRSIDFYEGGSSAAICMLEGDVWVVSGLDQGSNKLQWKRFATGLYEPSKLDIVNGIVQVQGRDQVTRLHDLNKDGEADWYEKLEE